MVKNWAIAIGVNQYEFLQPLKYAQRDAQLMQEFLRYQAGFERIFFFSDDSPDVNGKSTRPNRANLRRVLLELFKNPFMGTGDNFWFFFSGHGMRHNNRDYLMPCDGNPEDIEDTAIPINFVSERLRCCGSDNVVLILDACRNQGTRGEGIGRQTAQQARQTGVISIFSCSPNEYSYEIEALQQGAFTSALLEGLGTHGQCATVEQLNQYLTSRVPELVRQHKNTRQTPYTIAEPITKNRLILMPQHAKPNDIDRLKIDAFKAEAERNLELAEQIWLRVNAVSSGQDMDVITAIQRIERSRQELIQSFTNPQPSVKQDGQKSSSTELNDPIPQPDPIRSAPPSDQSFDVNVDYTRLQDLLTAQQWKEADHETYLVILRVVGREQAGWIRSKDLLQLPCNVLCMIDHLWVKHSNGKFGFSVQQRICRSIGGQPSNFDGSILYKFGDYVGWRQNNDWLKYDDFTFNLQAKPGHLPTFGYGVQQWGEWKASLLDFFPHVSTCL